MTWVPKNRATDGEDDDSKNGEDEKGKYRKNFLKLSFKFDFGLTPKG